MEAFAIEAEEVEMKFGSKRVLDSVSLRVSQGTICGLLGPNGSGKSTLCKILLNLITPASGESRILGERSAALPVELFNRVALVADWQELPGYMRVEEYFRYTSAFYERWDHALCADFARRFSVPLDQKIRTLSKGTKAKLTLIAALSIRPELVIADEPFAGIDIKAKSEICEAILAMTDRERWTILIASHEADELELLCDSFAFLFNRRIAVHDTAENLQGRYKQIECTTLSDSGLTAALPAEWIEPSISGRTLRAIVPNYNAETIRSQLSSLGLNPRSLIAADLSLKKLYVALATQLGDWTV